MNKTFSIVILTTLAVIALYFFVLVVSQGFFLKGSTVIEILRSPETLFAIRLSLITATMASFLAILFALPAAYALSRFSFWGKDFVDALIDIPIVLSPVVVGTAILMFFYTKAGAAIQESTVRFVFSFYGIILAQFTVVSALAIRLLKSTFDDLDPRYEKIARSLGYNRFQAFLKSTLPQCKNGVLAAFIVAWARSLGEFGATVTVAGATPMKTETLPIAIYLNLANFDLAKMASLMLILILIGLFALFFLRLFFHRGLY